LFSQDKGQEAEMDHFVNVIAKKEKPVITFRELENVSLTSFAAVESALTRQVIRI
jgi:hypothetical protein